MTLTVCQRLREHLATVYGVTPRGLPVDDWVQRLLTAARLGADQSPPPAHRNLWDERDVAVITYGDSVLSEAEATL